ncbi:hypothetical protein [Sphaerisporangium sp. NPDC051011]|uniref:hypothetical protein n=1 Tax=Sphaerisporangium sp. NPDC051011 TaxID=3155792 RepID=UPI0033F44B11
MTVRIESNAHLTPEQERIYRLRHTLERDGGTPGGFLELLASVIADNTWRQVPSGVNTDKPFTSFRAFVEAKPPFGLGHRAEDIHALLQIRHPHEGAKSVRQEMAAMRAEVIRLLAKDGITGYTEDQRNRDIKAWVALDRSGGWWLGFFVACQVRLSKSTVTASTSTTTHESNKISAQEFAKRAGISADRVMRYYRAWEAASADGVVTKGPDDLYPGHEPIELPPAEEWNLYYSSRKGAFTERGALIAAAAEAEGIKPTKALEVSENPTALRAAILADWKTAEAARSALLDRMRDDIELQATMASTLISDTDFKRAVTVETRRIDQLGFIRRVAEEGTIKTPAGQIVKAPEKVQAEARQHLALAERAETPSAALSAASAYDRLQQLIGQVIDDNPEIQSNERRALLNGRIRRAARAFADLDFDAADGLSDQETVESLERLLETVTRCLALIKRAAPVEQSRTSEDA